MALVPGLLGSATFFWALLGVIAVLLTSLAAGIWRNGRLTQRMHELELEREDRRSALARTSKLLIDKNMELFDQNVRQQQQLESKEDFISIVSHQLRTPATEMRWGLEALSTEMERHHAEGHELGYFKKLKGSATRMVRLIDSLVRLMSIDEDFRRPIVSAYEPDPIVRTAAEELAQRFADKHITLELSLDCPGAFDTLDCRALGLVVENLIENAYEYTPEGGKVTVATTRGPDGRFNCSVADTGVGIAKEKRATVFVKFQRSEVAMRMNSGGMGLGLYLVKNIVERSGGTVAFESEEGKGSTFRFSLPAKRLGG